MKKTKGLHELYNSDPITADKFLWGRESDPISRRGFLRKAGLASMSLALGSSIPFAKHFPAGMIPAALSQSYDPFELYGKDDLISVSYTHLRAHET